MNIRKISGTLLSIVETLGPVAGPTGKAIASIAAILHDQVLSPSQLEANAPIPFDKDNDSIPDDVDTDHGTVAAVTDEMIKAGLEVFYNWAHAPMPVTNTPPLAAIYLAMYHARPTR